MRNFAGLLKNRRMMEGITYTIILLSLVFLVVCPVGSIFIRSFQNEEGAFVFSNWAKIGEKRNITAVLNTMLLCVAVVFVSSLLALPTAFVLSKTKLRKFSFIDLILSMVFMVPPYINSTGWIYFMDDGGIMQTMFPGSVSFTHSFFSFWGMVMIMSFHSYPFLLTMMKSAFLSIPANLDDALSVYSRRKSKRLFSVYAPVLLPNYLIGAFLVFVKVLAEYGTPYTFGTKIGFEVFTTLLTDKITVTPIDFGVASSMSSFLIFICMGLWMLRALFSQRTYGLDATGKTRIFGKNMTAIVSAVFLFLLFFVSTVIPLGTIAVYSLMKSTGLGFVSSNFGFQNYVRAFSENEGFGTGLTSLLNTLYIAVISDLICLLLGYLYSFYSFRHRRSYRGKSTEILSLLPEMLPNIVLAIGFIMFYTTMKSPLYRTPGMLILAYSVIFLPNMVSYVKSGLTGISENVMNAGDVYSRSRFSFDFRVLIPLTLKDAFFGFMMTFIVLMRELVIAKLLQPPSYYVLSTYIDAQFDQGSSQSGMALSLITVLITLAILIPLEAISMKRKKGEKNA